MKHLAALGIFLTLIVAIVCLEPPPLQADGCFVNRSFYTGQSYSVPYVTPTYSHQKAYVAPTYNYHYDYTPKVVEVLVNPDYYYSVGSYYRDKVLTDAIVGRLSELQLKSQQKPGVDPPQSTAPPRVTMPPVETPPPGGVGPAEPQGFLDASPYQEPKLLATINQSCARCHNPTTAKGKLSLLTPDGKIANLSEGTWWKCFSLVSTGEMPAGGKAISDEETVLFHTAAKAAEKFARK